MATNAGGLYFSFSFDSDPAKLEKFNNHLEKMKMLSERAVVGMTALAGAGVLLTNKYVDAAVSLENLSTKFDISAQQMQKWQLTAERNDITTDELNSSFETIQQTLNDVAKGDVDKKFSRWGIALQNTNGSFKKADQVMQGVMERIKGLNSTQQQAILSSLGLNSALARMAGVSINSKSLSNLIMTPKDQQALLDFGTQFTIFQQTSSTFFEKIASSIAPVLTHLFKLASDAMNDIIPEVKTVFNALQNAWFSLEKTINTVVGLIEKYKGISIVALSAVLFAMRELIAQYALLIAKQIVASLTNPFVLAFLGATALMLVIDDIRTALEGGDSVIGEFFDVKQIRAFVKSLMDVADVIENDIVSAFQSVKDIINSILDFIMNIPKEIENLFANLDFSKFLPDWAVKLISHDDNKKALENTVAQTPSLVSNTSNNATKTNNVSIVINGADKDVINKVTDTLKKHGVTNQSTPELDSSARGG